jgi:hypothetical protein
MRSKDRHIATIIEATMQAVVLVCLVGCSSITTDSDAEIGQSSVSLGANVSTSPEQRSGEQLRIESLENEADTLRDKLWACVEQGDWEGGRRASEELMQFRSASGLHVDMDAIEPAADIELAVGHNALALQLLRQIPPVNGGSRRAVRAKLWLALLGTSAFEEASQYSQDGYLREKNLLIGYEELPPASSPLGLRARAHIALNAQYLEYGRYALATAHRRAASDLLPDHPELAWLAAEAINQWGVPAESVKYYRVAESGAYRTKAGYALYMLDRFEKSAPGLFHQRREWVRPGSLRQEKP